MSNKNFYSEKWGPKPSKLVTLMQKSDKVKLIDTTKIIKKLERVPSVQHHFLCFLCRLFL